MSQDVGKLRCWIAQVPQYFYQLKILRVKNKTELILFLAQNNDSTFVDR